MCFSMDDSINSIADHEDLLKQRYADINLQIQCLKKEQNRVSNNKHLPAATGQVERNQATNL